MCSSVNRLRFMVHPLRGDGLYPFLEELAGVTPRTRPSTSRVSWQFGVGRGPRRAIQRLMCGG
jgi:hypothetical protein